MNKELQKTTNEILKNHPELNRDMAFLVVVLKKYNFFVSLVMPGRAHVNLADIWRPTHDPHLVISSKKDNYKRRLMLFKLIKNNKNKYNRFSPKLTLSNLKERDRLLVLLDAFYATHTPSFYVRLIVEGTGWGSSMLICQGHGVMALPENKAARQQWLQDARAEMRAFAEFLSNNN